MNNVLQFSREKASGNVFTSNLCLESNYEYSEFLDPDMIFDLPEMTYIVEGILCSLEHHTAGSAVMRFRDSKYNVYVESIGVKNCVYMKTHDFQDLFKRLNSYCLERNY